VAERVRFLGALDRRGVLELFRAADASVLSSDWENFPHTVVEALAVGTPVIATAVGGVAEVLSDGVNGLVVPKREPALLAEAIRRYFGDPALERRLREGAAASVEHLSVATVYGDPGRGRPSVKPRVIFVARGRIAFPLSPTLEGRFAALSAELDWRQFGTLVGDEPSDTRFVLVPEPPVRLFRGAWFHLALPIRLARALRRFPADALVVQGTQETAMTLVARRLARSDAAVVCDVQGDWRAPTRLYGSRLRRLLAPLGDALGRSAVRRSDAVRTITGYTSRLVREVGVEPAAEFPTLMDHAAYTANPVEALPMQPVVLFVGVLERYKAVDVLAEAARLLFAEVPEVGLHVVGTGTLTEPIEALLRDHPERVRWTPQLPATGVARALDQSTLLVLPSRSEGMGRVVVEAFCRGRPVVGSRVGGIPDLVVDGVNGLLVAPEDASGLASALVRVLTDRVYAVRLSEGAARSAAPWLDTPEVWAGKLRVLVDEAIVRRTRA
jgi:glycosyltransferase involved in cell wall biosynthesis